MRFDYFGTGDSDGDDDEGDFDTWVANIVSANSELTKLSGIDRTAWLGMRLGASLCAIATSTVSRPPERLLLWEPVAYGKQYLRQLGVAHVEGLQADYGERWGSESDLRELAAHTMTTEVLGFPLTENVRKKIESITPSSFAGSRAQNISMFALRKDAGAAALTMQFRERGAAVTEYAIQNEIHWATNEAMNSSIVPAEALQTILSSIVDK